MTALSKIAAACAPVTPVAAILPGGTCTILCFSDLDAPLPETACLLDDGDAGWIARFWETGDRHAGIALIGATTLGELSLTDPGGEVMAMLTLPGRVSTEAPDLARHLQQIEIPMAEALHFVGATLCAFCPAEIVARFQSALLLETSEADGFVELVIRPDCGGVFLQGWAHTELTGALGLLGAGEGIAAVAASFDRDDILSPATGLCIFVKDWTGALDGSRTIFVDHGGRLLRLDILASVDPIMGAAGTDHVREMLPRLQAGKTGLEPFKRIVRPRFTGADTLAAHPGPVTAAVDHILATPSGNLFVAGWLLDPLDRVERVILKSTRNLYAPLHEGWHRTERPDLNGAFGADPRFAGRLDPRETLHGFISTGAPDPETLDGAEIYLELVLQDESCLFLPCTLTRCDGPGAAHPVLASLQPHDPALGTLLADHAAPFLATVPARRASRARTTVQPLAGGLAGRDIAAVMPFSDIAQLQPIMACLADTPEAAEIDLILVTGRTGAGALAQDLDQQFRFFGLSGALVLVPDHDTIGARLDAGAAISDSAGILVWQPSVLPRSPDWLRALRAQATQLCGPAVVAPLLEYEDGSIYFGGCGDDTPPTGAVCAMVGFERHRLSDARPRIAQSLPADILLIDRTLLARIGGFAGRLWGERFIGQDLSRRLAQEGARAWCIPAAEFWMLDARPSGSEAVQGIVDRIDAALIARMCRDAAQSREAPVIRELKSMGNRT